MERILYVDDELDNLLPLKVSLSRIYKVELASCGKEALELFSKEPFKVVLTDQRMPEMTGLELAREILKISPNTSIIMLTAFDDSPTIMEAINQGSLFRYLLKPWDLHDLQQTLLAAFSTYELKAENEELLQDLQTKNEHLEEAMQKISLLKEKLEEENIQLKSELSQNFKSESIIGVSEVISQALEMAGLAAKSDATVLLLGESGTGKELFVNEIHQKSQRHNSVIIKVNCAAIPENLIESDLFGHEKGAFTGADKRKLGKFELANNGTIFLDEIGELPLLMQSKLLRVLQEREFERVGGTQAIKANIRIIAATNRNLEEEVKKGDFRADLYYRLNVVPIKIPPLRERKEDIPILINYFIDKFNRRYAKQVKTINPKEIQRLIMYSWPGNVRELENIIERAVVLSNTSKLKIMPSFPGNINEESEGNGILHSLRIHERNYLLEVLKSTQWKIRGAGGAAEILKIPPSTLDSKLKKLNIKRPM